MWRSSVDLKIKNNVYERIKRAIYADSRKAIPLTNDELEGDQLKHSLTINFLKFLTVKAQRIPNINYHNEKVPAIPIVKQRFWFNSRMARGSSKQSSNKRRPVEVLSTVKWASNEAKTVQQL